MNSFQWLPFYKTNNTALICKAFVQKMSERDLDFRSSDTDVNRDFNPTKDNRAVLSVS